MIGRHERRALPARRDIVGAHVVNNGESKSPRQRARIADLHRQSLLGPMQHRLPVKTDHIDARAVDAVRLQKILDRPHMRLGDNRLRRRHRARPLRAVGDRDRIRQRLPQHGALVVRIGAEATRPLCDARLAVRLDQRDVDAIHRGAGHQADCAHHRHDSSPASNLGRNG